MAKKDLEVIPADNTVAEDSAMLATGEAAITDDASVALETENSTFSQTDPGDDADTLIIDEESGDSISKSVFSQTDTANADFSLEMHVPEENQVLSSQTDLTNDDEGPAFETAATKRSKNMPLSQTDIEEAASAAQARDLRARELIETGLSQTDTENAEFAPEGDEFSRAIAEKNANSQDGLTDAPEAVSAPRSSDRRKKTDVSHFQSDTERQPATPAGEAGTPVKSEPEQSPTPRRRRSRAMPVIPIDQQRTVETEADKLRNDLLDLIESQKSRKLLTGTIQGVERPSEESDLAFAVIYHGEFKVIIPAEEVVQPPADLRGRSLGEVMHYLISKRLGAEIDYVVKGVDAAAGIAAASRLEAMALKRRAYYLGKDRNGNYVLNEGSCAEARVTSVIRPGIFVDLFGIETYIPLRELSYQRWLDATDHFQSGQRVLVKIIELDRSDRRDIKVAASVKQAAENPYEKAFRRYKVGSRYVGTVSLVDTNGVFVSLEGGVDCLCTYPKRGRPPRGSHVTVRILGANQESNRIWGAITHMVTPR